SDWRSTTIPRSPFPGHGSPFTLGPATKNCSRAPVARRGWRAAFGVRGHVRALERGDMSPRKESGDVSPHSKSRMRLDGPQGRGYNFAASVKISLSGWGV